MSRWRLMLALGALVVAHVVSAQQTTTSQRLQPRRFEVRRATSAVTVDGVLDEPAGRRRDLRPPLRVDAGRQRARRRSTTEFLVTYDEPEPLRRLPRHDPEPAEIRAHLMDRDPSTPSSRTTTSVLMIDTFNDERRGWQFRRQPARRAGGRHLLARTRASRTSPAT